MRSLELLLIIFNTLLLGWVIFAKYKPQRFLLAGFGTSALLLLLHGIIEGMRLPMILAYLVPILPLVMIAVKSIRSQKNEKKQATGKTLIMKRILLTVLAIIYSLVAVALPILVPVFTFDKPSGPYKIGTVIYDWIDHERDEVLTPDTNDKRELMVQIWYPTDTKAKGSTSAYHPESDIFAQGYSQMFGFPKPLFQSLGYVKTHAIENAAISITESSYPVLIFSHGLTGNKMQNTFQIEQLVSHGYIVVGIDHTYSSTVSVFPDGRVAPLMTLDIQSIADLDNANKQWVEDAKFVLDQVEQLAVNDPDQRFTDRIDMERVGMFGHSFGGATSVQALMTDSRIKAAINMDGALYGELRISEAGLHKPFMMMSADASVDNMKVSTEDSPVDMPTEVLPRFDHMTNGGNYWMILNGMNHLSFTDMALFSPLFQLMQKQNIREGFRLINDYSLDFFDHYLKNQPLRLIEQHIGENKDFTLLKN